MKFKEKYAPESESAKEVNKEKRIISDDTFALGEMLEELKDKLEHLRLRFHG